MALKDGNAYFAGSSVNYSTVSRRRVCRGLVRAGRICPFHHPRRIPRLPVANFPGNFPTERRARSRSCLAPSRNPSFPF